MTRARAMAHARATAASTAWEVHETELQALQAIFMEDFELLRPPDRTDRADVAPPQCKITVRPQLTSPTDQAHVRVALVLELPRNYPNAEPVVSVDAANTVGLTRNQQAELIGALHDVARANIGHEMVHMLTQHAAEWLVPHNRPVPVSLHERMTQRIQQEQEQQQQQQQLLQQGRRQRQQQKTVGEGDDEDEDDGEEESDDNSTASSVDGAGKERNDAAEQQDARHNTAGGRPQASSVLPARTDDRRNSDGGGQWIGVVDAVAGANENVAQTLADATVHAAAGQIDSTAGPVRLQSLPHSWRSLDAWLSCINGSIAVMKEYGLILDKVVNRANVAERTGAAVLRLQADLQRIMNMASLRREPCLLRYISCSVVTTPEGGQRAVVASEFAVGATPLATLLESLGSGLEPERARQTVRQILEALVVLHNSGLAHGRLHAGNVFVDGGRSGRVRLCDYGIASAVSDLCGVVGDMAVKQSATADVPAMPYWIAPEVTLLGLVSQKADIWSLGWLAVEMCLGWNTMRDLQIKSAGDMTALLMSCHALMTADVRSLADCCLEATGGERWSAPRLLKHPYFTSKHGPEAMVAVPMETKTLVTPATAPRPALHASVATTADGDTGAASVAAPTAAAAYAPASRYAADFERVRFLGRGGFGSVVKVRNKLDGRFYAIKRVQLDPKSPAVNRRIIREVQLLSSLHHENIVRYYQAWTEITQDGSLVAVNEATLGDDADGDSRGSSTDADTDDGDVNIDGDDDPGEGGDDGADDATAPPAGDTRHGLRAHGSDGEHADGRRTGATTVAAQSPPDGVAPTATDTARRRSRRCNDDRDDWCDSDAESAAHASVRAGDWISSGGRSLRSRRTPDLANQVRICFGDVQDAAMSMAGGDAGDDGQHDSATASTDSPSAAQPDAKRTLGPLLYIQMEFCQFTLREVIDDGLPRLPAGKQWRMFWQIVEGLAYIHDQGIIHRDLKPSNVFIALDGHAKLGDFGLATCNTDAGPDGGGGSTDLSEGSRGANGAEATDAVGTLLYVAPELLHAAPAVRYNQKVDMYSLGIVFFEMCWPMPTVMHRAHALAELRKNPACFPAGFPRPEQDSRAYVMQQLLSHNSRDRPSARRLLSDKRLPPRIEDRSVHEIMAILSNPDSIQYNRLMEALFSRERGMPDPLHDLERYQRSVDVGVAIQRGKVVERMCAVMRRHGAVDMDSPLLVPRAVVQEQQNAVVILDSLGLQLALPYDLTSAFARLLAPNPVRRLKRYHVNRVFRRAPNGSVLHELWEADFAVFYSQPAIACIADAEVLTVAGDVLREFPAVFAGHRCSVRVNHVDIVTAVVDECAIGGLELQRKVCAILAQAAGNGDPWPLTRNRLLASTHIDPAAINRLAEWFGPKVTAEQFEVRAGGRASGRNAGIPCALRRAVASRGWPVLRRSETGL